MDVDSAEVAPFDNRFNFEKMQAIPAALQRAFSLLLFNPPISKNNENGVALNPLTASKMNPSAPTALHRFFQQVHPSSDALAAQMASHFTPAEITKGGFFLEEGQRSNEYLFLEKGFMRSFLFDTDGAEVTTNFYTPGNVVFEAASFFQHIPSQESFVAITHCTGWKISFPELNKLFHTLPSFRETGRTILVKTLVSLKMRTLSMINQTAEQRYTTLLSDHPEIFQAIPLKYIASYLGITDTSLSRIRKEMGSQ